ncbi:hypothetical protein CGMCC3_g432 [Colletotrichum fructicola]|nr:uncharacterized protein CGMCC3_g432 [Colletotrichum fructicola]KAE9583619.1 hypothetical protein CGMCC3_g432 [Colletotrichum fructicola]
MINIPTKSLRVNSLINRNEQSAEIGLQLEEDLFIIRNISTNEYGGLLHGDTPGAQVLKRLYKQHHTFFQAFLLRKRQDSASQKKFELYVLVYGMERLSGAIGRLLDSAGFYLQQPHLEELPATYQNPHCLRNPVMSSAAIEKEHLIEAVGAAAKKSGQKSKASSKVEQQSPLMRKLEAVVDSAQGPLKYSAILPSPRLRTQLKTHQLKALSMMKEKESGRLGNNEFGSIWTSILTKGGHRRYKNLVTGSVQTSVPCVCRGGDDMGLGKTLTAIALVASSLDTKSLDAGQTSCSGTTLIVCPVILLQEWEEQIQRHIHPGKMSYLTYHGSGRRKASSFESFDVVLTTYHTVAAVQAKTAQGSVASALKIRLQGIQWERIILDEAHVIRNRSTNTFKAVNALRAHYRWCLTGTPIFNSVEDYGSLLGFIRAEPFDTASSFNSRVATSVKKGHPRGIEVLQKLVQATCLRRTKDIIAQELNLPTCHKPICEVRFTDRERQLYDVLKNSFAVMLSSETTSTTSSIFQTILRLRQFCNHGLDLLPQHVRDFLEYPHSGGSSPQNPNIIDGVCSSCGQPEQDGAQQGDLSSVLDCGHNVCFGCRDTSVARKNGFQPMCVACQQNTERGLSEFEDGPRPVHQPSSKVLALLENIKEDEKNSKDESLKSVVFSCWTSMLDLVSKALLEQRRNFSRIDGSMSESAKREAINEFRSKADCNILLASIGSAGTGLDMTVASRIHLLEPQWTPMAEAQALDRVHRIGQKKEVIARRYVVTNSIEEYIVTVQQVKSALITQSFVTEEQEKNESARERLAKYLTSDTIH